MKHFASIAVSLVALSFLAGLSQTAAAQSLQDLKDVKDLTDKIPRSSKSKHKDKSADAGDAKSASNADPAKSQGDKTSKQDLQPPPIGGDEPTIAKDFIAVNAFTFSAYQKNSEIYSWAPKIKFRVNGPIPSGSQLYVEFTLPTGPWVKFDCKTREVAKGDWLDVEGGARDVPEDKGVTYTGPVDFTIKMRNELSGADTALFTGKIKVAKVHSNENAERYPEHFVYYVDQDWNLPIGYVFLTPEDRKWERPRFNVAFWVRGEANFSTFEPHVFYKGKEVGKIYLDGNERGKAGCDRELDFQPNQGVDDSLPQKALWTRIICDFPSIKGWDKSGEKRTPIPGETGSMHMLADNPGEYEVKVLWQGKLARSIKFTIGADGKFDSGIAAANKLGSHRAIYPVKIIGDQDGQWDKDAWKTDAFYGNPLTGFAALP